MMENDDESSHTSDNYGYGEYGHDSSFNDLPPKVQNELDRRQDLSPEEAQEAFGSASEEVHLALREWFLGGGKPSIAGGYLDLMEELGLSPRSDDVLVKDIECNVYQDPKEELKMKNEVIDEHYSRVRLSLRYAEFLEKQEQDGLGPLPDFAFTPFTDFSAVEGEDGPKESSLKNEDVLTREQILGFGQEFVRGFYHYTKPAPGTKTKATPGVQTELSDQTLHSQLIELRVRYEQHGCPLGEAAGKSASDKSVSGKSATGERKKTGNKKKIRNNKRRSSASDPAITHPDLIAKHVTNMLLELEKMAQPTAATAGIYNKTCEMLVEAVKADVDVARALVAHENPERLVRLQQISLKYALQADKDMTRPKWVPFVWWKAFDDFVGLGFFLVYALTKGKNPHLEVFQSRKDRRTVTPDRELATSFFQGHLEPALVQSITSEVAAERMIALKVYAKAVKILPHKVASRITKDKEMWEVLRDVCSVDDGGRPPEKLNQRQALREKEMTPFAAAEGVRVFVSLCQSGMVLNKDSGQLQTSIGLDKIACKMISKGVVPVLMDLSLSPHQPVACAALDGLSHISRAKDCRVLMLQDPNCVQMVREMLKSPVGDNVSNAMLLVVHLLWDKEWQDLILSFSDPPLEETAIRWAAYCMKSIRDLAFEMRSGKKTLDKERQSETMEVFRTNRVLLKVEKSEITAKSKSTPRWLDVETMGLEIFACLRRCNMVLSKMSHACEPERLLNVNVLGLASCCIDVPDEEAHEAVGKLMYKLATSNGGEALPPGLFIDPGHIVNSLFRNQELIFTQLILTFQQQESWFRYVCIELARIHNLPLWNGTPMARRDATITDHDGNDTKNSSSVHNSCMNLTGKLRQCEGCGKMEGKKGDFERCGRCKVAVYCGRDCQHGHWKQHKKICGKKK